MKINFSQVLINIDDKPIEDESKREIDTDTGKILKSGPDLRMGDACIRALLNSRVSPKDNKKDLEGTEKLHFYVLSVQIKESMRDKKLLSVTSEDIVLLKAVVAATYFPVIVGQVWQMLEGEKDTQEPESEKPADGAETVA